MRQRFGGKVDHLQAALGEEPQPGSQHRKSFLYLYDSVPGGTGYVRQLIEAGGADLRAVFEQSLQTLQRYLEVSQTAKEQAAAAFACLLPSAQRTRLCLTNDD